MAPPKHLRSRARFRQKRKQAILLRCFGIGLAILVLLFVLILLATSGSSGQDKSLRSKFHNIVEHEIVGYGPSHPRAAVIIVATEDLDDPIESMKNSITSVLSHTDRNRIFVVCAVFQNGVLTEAQQAEAEAQLNKLDAGTVNHWHGMIQHAAHSDSPTDHEHSRKIKPMFLDNTSVTASRNDAAQYIQILAETHEKEGFKSTDENIIAVFIRPDSTIETDHWVDTVTHGLIGTNEGKTSNAISFAASSTETISEGETKSASLYLKPIKSHAPKEALSLTQGQSYPTPIVEGAVTAMTLETFLNFPVSDVSLDSHFASDLEMSFNLWLCADGIDIVTMLRAKTTLGLLQHKDKAGVSSASMARMAYTWMGGENTNIGKQVLNLDEKSGSLIGNLRSAGELDDLPDVKKLSSCRTFYWYAKEVNEVMGEELSTLPNIHVKRQEPNAQHYRKVPSLSNANRKELPAQKIIVPPKPAEDVPVPVAKSELNTPSEKSGKRVGIAPEKPLSQTNKDIISTAKFVDLAFVDVSGGHKEHPHMGALDENGQPGYVHDEKALHKNPPKFEVTKDQAKCDVKDGDYKMLTEKVFVDLPAHEAAESIARSGVKPRAKLFCLVYTIEKFHDRVPAIRETWGSKCDGFMVGSTKTDKALGTVEILHEGEEAYGNIWQKVRAMWSYIYDNYYEEYDWFHIGGDDLYLLVENLRLYLESDEIQLAGNGGEVLPNGKETDQLPLFLGRRFKEQGNAERMFNSGGSGYSMNKAALKALVVDAFPTCMPHLTTFAEDVMVAQCMRNKLQVFPFDTKDENGGERYMPFAPKHHLNYRIPENVKSDWYANYSVDIKTGLDHCAARSVAFHYIKGDLMKRLHAILYGRCA